MDPIATWHRFLDACNDIDLDEAIFALGDLCRWMEADGPPPTDVDRGTIITLYNWLQGTARLEGLLD